ncbi:MAG: 1,4-dihydroxy-2-naphthoate polyprenyltransferase [Longimicrobiales bacterium]
MSVSRPRAWLLAARPRTLTAAAAPVVAGTGLAAHHGVLSPLPAVAALVGALLIQVATNLANDYYDFVRGGDTAERVGPVRVTQAGILPPATVFRGMLVALGLAFLVGVYLVAVGGWPIVWIGLASLACAVLYTGGPFPLAYHGLGDVFVFVFFGLVAVGGTYYVQGLAWPPDVWLAGVGLGALSTAILVVNNLRDIDTDTRAGKRTLAVRLGPSGTRVEYVVLLLVAAAVPVVGVVGFGWPGAALASLAALAGSVAPLRRVFGYDHPAELIPALGQTARIVALYGVLLGTALALA